MRPAFASCAALLLAGPASAQLGIFAPPAGDPFRGAVFATPMPPGPGTVTLPTNAGPLAAPVFMPLAAPTAAPVGVYHYAPPTPASDWSLGGAIGAACFGAAAEPAPQSAAPTTPCRGGGLYASADFLYAASQGMNVPPLVAVVPAGAVPQANGRLTPFTDVKFGGDRVNDTFRSGLRAGVGYWFGPDRRGGVDASFLYLGNLSERLIAASSPGGAALVRPVTVGVPGSPVGVVVAGPFVGGVTASADTFLIGGDASYRRNLCGGCTGRLDMLIGYRYLHLGDTVDVWDTRAVAAGTALPAFGAVAAGGSQVRHDSFRTRNDFHGPQLGLAGFRTVGGGFFVEGALKVGVGVTVSDVSIDGTTTLTGAGLPAGGAATVPAGLLATPTNAGSRSDTSFAVLPEAAAKVGYELCDGLRVTAGYTFLYWSHVRRAGEQIDATLAPPGRPAFPDRTTDLWVQGVTFGAEWRY